LNTSGTVHAVRQTARALWHVGSDRAIEVLLLQASPLLGAAFGGAFGGGSGGAFERLAVLLVGSVLLTAHVFAFNDWAGHRGDLNDPRREPHVFAHHDIGSRAVAALAVALLAAAMATLAALGSGALVLGASIACVGFFYSDTQAAGKGVPGFASLMHLVGGALHFLLGYNVIRAIDSPAIVIALFFGLVFAGGHLNHEVGDHEADRGNGIRTTAVVYGPRRALLASLAVFSTAYGELILLAALGVVPRPLLWTAAVLWPLHVRWTLQALRGEPGFAQSRWLQRRYRLLFALVGAVMLVSLAE
jgi:4-hydroxybenzoate polyprenyltransferase